jgi:hypothetical protein
MGKEHAMKLTRVSVHDPAVEGFSNDPRAVLTVEYENHYDVVGGWPGHGYLDLSKMEASYYYGQGDQFNKIAGEVLTMMLQDFDKGSPELRPAANKRIWVVWRLPLHVPLYEPSELVQFMVYDVERCTSKQTMNMHNKGAFTHKLDHPDGDGTLLVNGWSGRASVFNSTGIAPHHVMEVDLVEGGSAQSGFCAPVNWLAREVRRVTNGLYQVEEGVERTGGYPAYRVYRDLQLAADRTSNGHIDWRPLAPATTTGRYHYPEA